jgi:hypothetical protein
MGNLHRQLWELAVVGSNPTAPTIKNLVAFPFIPFFSQSGKGFSRSCPRMGGEGRFRGFGPM